MSEAKAALERAQDEAALYGLTGEATARAVCFVLPEVQLEEVPAYRQEWYALRQAEFNLQKA